MSHTYGKRDPNIPVVCAHVATKQRPWVIGSRIPPTLFACKECQGKMEARDKKVMDMLACVCMGCLIENGVIPAN